MSTVDKLAIAGGTPAVVPPIPYKGHGYSMIGEEEKRAVMEVMNRGTLSRYVCSLDATYGYKFELECARMMGSKYCVALNSGTACLHVSLVAFDLGIGDEVLVPVMGWSAIVSAVISVGAMPVPVEPSDDLCICLKAIEASITPRTKAIVVVHYDGHAADMQNIMEIARKHNLYVLEDVAQSDGGSCQGKRMGTWGHIGLYSFNAQKLMTCGEGGAVVTDDVNLFARIVSYAGLYNLYHGRYPELKTLHLDQKGWPNNLHMNYRMPELASAVAYAQILKLDEMQIKPIKKNRNAIRDGIADLDGKYGWRFANSVDEEGSVGYELLLVFENPEDARAFVAAAHAEGVINVRGMWVFGFMGGDQSGFIKLLQHEGLTDSMNYWSSFLHAGRYPAITGRLGITSKLNPWKLAAQLNPDAGEVSVEEVAKRCERTQAMLDRRAGICINPQLTAEHIAGIVCGIRKITLGLHSKK